MKKYIFTCTLGFCLLSLNVQADESFEAFYSDEPVTLSYSGDDQNVFRLTFMHILEGSDKPYRWRVRNSSGKEVSFQWGFTGGTKSQTIVLEDGEEYYFSTDSKGTMKLFDANGKSFKNEVDGVKFLTTKASGTKTKTPPSQNIPIDGGLSLLLAAGLGYGAYKRKRNND